MKPNIEQLEEALAAVADPRERVRLLHDLGKALWRTEPRRSRDLAEEGLHLARSIGDRSGEGYACVLHAVASMTLGDMESPPGHLDRALEIAAELEDRALEAKARVQRVQYFAYAGEYARAIEIGHETIALLERIDLPETLVHALLTTAAPYIYGQQPESGLDLLFRAAELSESIGLERERAVAYNNIGLIFEHFSEKTDGLSFLIKSFQIQSRTDDPYATSMRHYALAKRHQEEGDPESAVPHLLRGLQLARDHGFGHNEVGMLELLADTYRQLGRRDDELQCLEQMLALIGTRAVGGSHLGAALQALGSLFAERGEWEPAERHLLEAMEAADPGNNKLRSKIAGALSCMFERRGMFERALEYHRKLMEAELRRVDVETNAKLAGIQSEFQVKMLEKERAIQELETARLRDEMEHRNRELAIATLQLVEKSEHVRKLKEQLREIRVTGCSGIDGALKRIESELGSENDWERFARQFEHVHAGFGERLAKRHPTLTPTEVRICSLLKVQLSSKEIANLLSIEVRTVEIHRGRIRKKLGLTQKNSLGTFITAL